MSWFTLEFLLNLFAAPANERYGSWRRFLLSVPALVDILTIAPFP